jgi:hypothetical protein
MIPQPQPAQNIPSRIYELAISHNVGAPLKRHRNNIVQIILIFDLLAGILVLGWLGYVLYGYVAFSILAHTYPNINTVPDTQLDNYTGLQALHDDVWSNILLAAAPVLTLLGQYMTFSSTNNVQLYICADGLLKIERKKDEAIRWDAIKELYPPIGSRNRVRLVKQDGSNFLLPSTLVSSQKGLLDKLIVAETMSRLFPEMLERYEQNEMVDFDGLRINQKGIYGPWAMVEWQRIGDISLDGPKLAIYYSTSATNDEGRWHTWQKRGMNSTSWPNLPLFLALATTILDQHGAKQMETTPFTPQRHSLKEAARKSRKRKHQAIATMIISISAIILLGIGIAFYQAVQEQQQTTRETKNLQNHFAKIAYQPYTVAVPGEHCGGNNNQLWLDDDSKNVYACQKDGLLMTRKDMPYLDEEWFSLVPFSLSSIAPFSSSTYFPHNYRVQVQATILSGGLDTCVSVDVHAQSYQNNQSFDICANGSWDYDRLDPHSMTLTQIDTGNLPSAKKSYLIEVNVTDDVLILRVDNTTVTLIRDSTYDSTDQIGLSLYGNENDQQPNSVLFSDFSYLPY